MTNVILSGKRGGSIEVKQTEELYIVKSIEYPDYACHLRDVKNFETRPDDVIMCTYPKSGLHWVTEIASMLLRGSTEPMSRLVERYFFDSVPTNRLETLPSPRLFCTHLRPHHMPVVSKTKGYRRIFVLRDPRAIAVSYFHYLKLLKDGKFKGEWVDFLSMFIEGKVPWNSWFEYIKDWAREIKAHPECPVHVMYYEDLINNPLDEVQRLATYLGVPASLEFCAEVTRRTSFHNLKQSKEALKGNSVRKHFQGNVYPFYRKGQPDDWKNHFTVSQNEEFNDVFGEKMKGSGIKLRSSL